MTLDQATKAAESRLKKSLFAIICTATLSFAIWYFEAFGWTAYVLLAISVAWVQRNIFLMGAMCGASALLEKQSND